jgi:cell pole-organizing protein PopZ
MATELSPFGMVRAAVGKRAMSQTAKVQEPSMEEILASIRRIIADDDAAKPKAAEPPKPAVAAPAPPPPPKPAPAPAPAPAAAKNSQDDIDAMFAGMADEPAAAPEPPPPPPAPEPASDILDLTEAMEMPDDAPSFRRIDGGPDVVFREPDPPPPSPPPARNTVDNARLQFEHRTEIDRSLLSPATSAAVDSAFNSLANTVLVQNARTLDDLVREMLRPMLKAWLDDNLPNMVERMIRAEIERVSRGR